MFDAQGYAQRAMKHEAEADVGPLGSTEIQTAPMSPMSKLDAVAAGSAFAGGAWGGLIEEAEVSRAIGVCDWLPRETEWCLGFVQDCAGGLYAKMSERETMSRML